MGNPITIEIKCPNCGKEFEDIFAGVLHLSGKGFRSDFKPGFDGDSPISELLLYQCSHCGFTERSVLDRFETPLSPDIQKFAVEALPNIWRGSDTNNSQSVSKFENYAQYLEFNGARQFDLGKAYLRASWINDSDEYMETAFGYFENAVSEKDAIGSAEAPFAAYLAAEMARKAGKFLPAERLYHVANKLSSKSPELAIRTYSFLLEMSHRQSTAPTDEAIWNFSEGLILDPLDYYHAKVLTSIGVYFRYTQQYSALLLYDRAFNLCKPAMERTISTKTPKVKFSADNGYLAKQLVKRSMSTNNEGFWVDSGLLMMGLQSLNELKNLKSIIQDSVLIEKVEVESRNYVSEMWKLEKDLKKLSSRGNKSEDEQSYKDVDENRIEKVWNLVFFIILGLTISLAASLLTFFGLEAIKVYKYWILIFGGTVTAWLIWASGQRLLGPVAKLIGRFTKKNADHHPIVRFVIPILVFLTGLVLSIIVGGWPAIISNLLSIGILLLINFITRTIRKRKPA